MLNVLEVKKVIDYRDIVGDLLGNVVWKLKSDFLIKSNVLMNSLYCPGHYNSIKDFINTYFKDVDTYDFNIFNVNMLNWCGSLNSDADEFLDITFTKVLNDILSNIINVEGSVDSCLSDYQDIVKSSEVSNVSKTLLTYFHSFILKQIDYVKNKAYEFDVEDTQIDLTSYGIDKLDVYIPRYIDEVYVTLIRNPKLKPLLNKEIITKGTPDYHALEKYIQHIENDKYSKAMCYYIHGYDYHRVDMYKTILGDIKLIKRNTY